MLALLANDRTNRLRRDEDMHRLLLRRLQVQCYCSGSDAITRIWAVEAPPPLLAQVTAMPLLMVLGEYFICCICNKL